MPAGVAAGGSWVSSPHLVDLKSGRREVSVWGAESCIWTGFRLEERVGVMCVEVSCLELVLGYWLPALPMRVRGAEEPVGEHDTVHARIRGGENMRLEGERALQG